MAKRFSTARMSYQAASSPDARSPFPFLNAHEAHVPSILTRVNIDRPTTTGAFHVRTDQEASFSQSR